MPVDLARLGPDARAQVERQLGAKPKRYRYKRPRIDMAPLWLHAWRCTASAGLRRDNEWQPEYRFSPPRRWRFDWALPERKIAVEVDGGRWLPGGGRHGSDADREKLNKAAALGWRVVRFSPKQLTDDPAGCVAEVERALREEQ